MQPFHRATGINLTKANVLIFAKRNNNKLKDMQVKGWIFRTTQTQETWIYIPRVLDSYDKNICRARARR